MKRKHRHSSSIERKKTTRILAIMGSLLFCTFSIVYLGIFQGDLMEAIVAHEHPDMPVYNRWLGAVTITAVLQLLQFLIRLIRIRRKWFSFSYLPSFFILGVLTFYRDIEFYYIVLAVLVFLFILLLIPVMGKRAQKKMTVKAYRTYIINLNLLELIIFSVLTLSIGNTNDNLHYELAMNRYIKNNEPEKALLVGRKSSNPNRPVTALRTLALSKLDRMGEALFEYPQLYEEYGLLYAKQYSNDNLGFMPTDLYEYLGFKQESDETPTAFLQRFYKSEPENKIAFDYYWSATLLDNQLDSLPKFVEAVKEGRFYDIKKLPKHFAEAVVLYNHLNPETPLSEALEQTDKLSEFIAAKEQTFKSTEAEAGFMQKQYGSTYWWYYFYQSEIAKIR